MTDAPHLSAWLIAAVAQGTSNVPPGALAHLRNCPDCRHELDLVVAARAEFQTSVLPRTRQQIERRFSRRRRNLWAALALVPALGAVLALWLPRRAGIDDLGIKGDAALRVFVRRSGRVFSPNDGDTLAPGDQLRFEVDPGGLSYLLIVSVDALGHASTYVPYGGEESLAVDPDARFLSPGSIALDSVPGPERLFVLLSRAPLREDAVRPALQDLGRHGPDAIRAARRLPVPADAQLSFLWQNEPP